MVPGFSTWLSSEQLGWAQWEPEDQRSRPVQKAHILSYSDIWMEACELPIREQALQPGRKAPQSRVDLEEESSSPHCPNHLRKVPKSLLSPSQLLNLQWSMQRCWVSLISYLGYLNPMNKNILLSGPMLPITSSSHCTPWPGLVLPKRLPNSHPPCPRICSLSPTPWRLLSSSNARNEFLPPTVLRPNPFAYVLSSFPFWPCLSFLIIFYYFLIGMFCFNSCTCVVMGGMGCLEKASWRS